MQLLVSVSKAADQSQAWQCNGPYYGFRTTVCQMKRAAMSSFPCWPKWGFYLSLPRDVSITELVTSCKYRKLQQSLMPCTWPSNQKYWWYPEQIQVKPKEQSFKTLLLAWCREVMSHLLTTSLLSHLNTTSIFDSSVLAPLPRSGEN